MTNSLQINDILGYQADRGLFRYQIKKIDISKRASGWIVDLLPLDEHVDQMITNYPISMPLQLPWSLVEKFQLEEYV